MVKKIIYTVLLALVIAVAAITFYGVFPFAKSLRVLSLLAVIGFAGYHVYQIWFAGEK